MHCSKEYKQKLMQLSDSQLIRLILLSEKLEDWFNQEKEYQDFIDKEKLTEEIYFLDWYWQLYQTESKEIKPLDQLFKAS